MCIVDSLELTRLCRDKSHLEAILDMDDINEDIKQDARDNIKRLEDEISLLQKQGAGVAL